MFLHALATAVPDPVYTQEQCWAFAQKPALQERLKKRSMLILRTILRGEHGIATRHFAVDDPGSVFSMGPDELNAVFREHAPRLAGRALSRALDNARITPNEIDALLVCTCTGYLCPGITSYVSEQLGLRTDTFLQDLVGLGCGAAIPTLRAADAILAAHPEATVACVAVEICSAAFYIDDDPGVIISACLFGDGAAATLWRSTPSPERPLRAFDFRTVHLPQYRDKLRFECREGKLRNLLDRAVPELAADAVSRLWRERGERPVAQVIAHSGGRDVIEAVAPVVAPHSLDSSARVLRAFGNMSSPSVLFVLEDALRTAPPNGDGDYWLVSFGAGFAAHCCRIAATDHA
jgi:alkylresorcinol/alkylpyrone synthase